MNGNVSRIRATGSGTPVRRSRRALALLVCGLMILAAAGAVSRLGAETAGEESVASRPAPTADNDPDGAAPGESNLVVALDAQPLDVDGETFYVLVLGVMTASADGETVTFPGGRTHDFVVLREGRELWRWSAGKVFHQAVVRREFEPGRLYVFSAVWDGRDDEGRRVSGDVEVRGVLAATPEAAAPPVTLHVD